MLALDRRGWLHPHQGVQIAPSPNFNARPVGNSPYLLVIHNISLPPHQFTGPAVVQFFQNQLPIDAHPWFKNIKDLTVSAHFFIRRDGHLIQFVSTDDRAWHAGISIFNGIENCNDFSLGVELEGADDTPYTQEQYDCLTDLTEVLSHRYTLRAVRGHEHIASGRKTDPGPAFDWWHYANQTDLALRLFPPF